MLWKFVPSSILRNTVNWYISFLYSGMRIRSDAHSVPPSMLSIARSCESNRGGTNLDTMCKLCFTSDRWYRVNCNTYMTGALQQMRHMPHTADSQESPNGFEARSKVGGSRFKGRTCRWNGIWRLNTVLSPTLSPTNPGPSGRNPTAQIRRSGSQA